MKKLLYVMLMMVLAAGLAACGDAGANDSTNAEAANNDQDQAGEVAGESTDDESAEEAGGEAGDPLENESFAQVADMLKSNGFEVTDVEPGMDDVVGSEESVTMVVNGEDMLTFQVFKVEEGHENLDKVNETGEATLEFDGQQGEVPGFYAIGNYVFFLGEGHPDREEINTLIKDNFSPQ